MNASITFAKKRTVAPGSAATTQSNGENSREAGFSLIEAAIALVIIMIALLGVAQSIAYAVTYNAGNNSRAKTLAILQQEVERLRSAKFTPTLTDPMLLGCDIGQPCSTSTVSSGPISFVITKTIDNDPSTPGIDDESEILSADTSFKEIKVSATLASPSPGWQTAIPAEVVLRRVKSN
jgi:type II secretory pathway pseudopilin PulG